MKPLPATADPGKLTDKRTLEEAARLVLELHAGKDWRGRKCPCHCQACTVLRSALGEAE